MSPKWDDIKIPGNQSANVKQTEPVEVPESKLVDINPFKNIQFDVSESKQEDIYYADIPESAEPGIEGQFYLTQSIIKMMVDQNHEEVPHCPRNIYHTYVKKDFRNICSDAMMEGNYGEYLILGKNAKNNQTVMLPQNARTGGAKISQQRIEMQAEMFRHHALQMQINVIPGCNTQVPIFKRFGNSNVIIRGELDLFPTPVIFDDELQMAIIDIKFTGDVNSSFGKYGWGGSNIDFIQGDTYQWLIRDFDLELNAKHGAEFNRRVGYKNIFTDTVKKLIDQDRFIFLYMIFGYKKADLNNQFKIIQRMYKDPNGGDLRQREFVQRVKKVSAMLSKYHNDGWQPNPNEDVCKKCPVHCDRINGYCTEPKNPIKV